MVIRKKRKIIPKSGACYFCKNKREPDYKETDSLRRYISERGKVQSREKTGLCRKHQTRIATAIKRARHLALLPFIVRTA
ncbi:MAG: 30S ribosomal protein S18 [bacterium]|nr:30S ribosomal protein S18 [bacterium]